MMGVFLQKKKMKIAKKYFEITNKNLPSLSLTLCLILCNKQPTKTEIQIQHILLRNHIPPPSLDHHQKKITFSLSTPMPSNSPLLSFSLLLYPPTKIPSFFSLSLAHILSLCHSFITWAINFFGKSKPSKIDKNVIQLPKIKANDKYHTNKNSF